MLSSSRRRFLRLSSGSFLLPLSGIIQAGRAFGEDIMVLPARFSGKATQSLMLSVFSVNQRIVSVGERGVILISADSGATWAQAASPTSVTLTGVYFVDDMNGWAVGHSGVVLCTKDGGKTWYSQFDGNQANAQLLSHASRQVSELKELAGERAINPNSEIHKRLERAKETLMDVEAGQRFGPARPLLDLWFYNNNEGYVVGSYGQIFETRDSGASWQYIGHRLDNPESLHLNAIVGSKSGTLMVVGEAGRIWISTDKGRRWINGDTNYKGQIYGGIIIPSENNVDIFIVFGFGGKIFRSIDSGKTWVEPNGGRTKTLIAGKTIGDRIMLVDVEGAILESNDYGRTYKLVSESQPFQIRGFAISATDKLILAGFGGLHIIPPISRGGISQ